MKRQEEGLDGYDWYEGQPKWPMRRIIGVAVAAISVFIYGFLFVRFFTAFTGGVGEVILLTGKSSEAYPSESAAVRRFYPATGEGDDGSVQVQYVVALEETDSFQFTLKIRKKAHPPAGDGAGYRVVLRYDRDGETRWIEMRDYQKKDAFGYRYLVCLFDDVKDASSSTLTVLLLPGDHTGQPALADAVYTATVGGSGVYSAEIHPREDAFLVKNETDKS